MKNIRTLLIGTAAMLVAGLLSTASAQQPQPKPAPPLPGAAAPKQEPPFDIGAKSGTNCDFFGPCGRCDCPLPSDAKPELKGQKKSN